MSEDNQLLDAVREAIMRGESISVVRVYPQEDGTELVEYPGILIHDVDENGNVINLRRKVERWKDGKPL